MKLIHIAVGEVFQNLDEEKNSMSSSNRGGSLDPNRERNLAGFPGEAIE
jgi:hypothetical protein